MTTLEEPVYPRAQITSTANVIKQTFQRLKSAVMRAPYNINNPRANPSGVWEKAAIACLDVKGEPEQFVQAVFDAFTGAKQGPRAPQLTGEYAKKVYRRRYGQATGEAEPAVGGVNIFEGPSWDEDRVKLELLDTINFSFSETGKLPPDPKFMNNLMVYSTPGPAMIKALLGATYGHEQLVHRYGKEAQNTLCRYPAVATYCKNHGLNVDKVLAQQVFEEEPGEED